MLYSSTIAFAEQIGFSYANRMSESLTFREASVSTSLRVAALATVVLLAACGSDSGTGPASTPSASLDQLFSQMSVPGVSAAAGLGGGGNAPAASVTPSGCSYASATQSFVCGTLTANGLTVSQSYQLFDASGAPLSAFDAARVSSVRLRGTVSGTVTADGNTIKLDAQSDQTSSGLQTSTHTLNGTSVSDLSGTIKTGTTTQPFTSRSATTMANLVLPANAGAASYPSSGTITVDQTSSFGGGTSVAARIVMTFDGTSKVKVTVTVGGLTMSSCTMNLASPAPSCA